MAKPHGWGYLIIGGDPNINAGDHELPASEAAPVPYIGTACMLINVAVFHGLAAAHPEWKYKLYPSEVYEHGREWAFDFFKVGPDPETGYYLSEDFFFVKEARKIGFETFVLPDAITSHVGIYEYKLNLPLLAASGLNVRGILKQEEGPRRN